MVVMVSNTHIPSSSPIITLVCSRLSLSFSRWVAITSKRQSRTCRRRRCPIPKPPLGYLIHVIACPHWPMHRHAESKPIINSSTWGIGRAVSARAKWVEFRRAESNNAKLKTRNDSRATALETEQKISNVIGKSRSETTPPSQQGRRQWVGRINQRKVPNTRTRRRTKRLRSDSCTHCSLSLLSLLLVVGVVVDTTRTSSSSRRRRRRRKTKSLLERSSSLSHPLSLILSYNSIWEREWVSERESYW